MPQPSEGLAAQGWGVCGWWRCNGGKTSPRPDANGPRRQAPGRQLCLWSHRGAAANTVRSLQRHLEIRERPWRRLLEGTRRAQHQCIGDRKSVALGQSVSLRVALGGRRIIKKTKTYISSKKKNHNNT